MKHLSFVMCFAFVLFVAPLASAVVVDTETLPDAAQEAMAKDIMREVRCLVCQNQSIEDSESPLAQDLRRVVRERVAIGEDRRTIKTYLTARYGDWILLQPPFKSQTLILWILPVLILCLGGWLVLHYLRSSHKTSSPQPLSVLEQKALEDLLHKDRHK